MTLAPLAGGADVVPAGAARESDTGGLGGWTDRRGPPGDEETPDHHTDPNDPPAPG
ncbi:hypothetical protein [Embleya sp. NPDC005971]|uniref:hypothetical protein n=1 Tax=Embleya sp. NPDC005971 TaxID=3156724 RepID=UPI0033F0A6F6